jgi:DNA processing protein
MNSVRQGPGHGGACSSCLRRSWLLSVLSAALDHQFRDLERLTELLALSDEHLLGALGGRRKAELMAGYVSFEARDVPSVSGDQAVCCHRSYYPRSLRDDAGSPAMLNVEGGAGRLQELTAAPTVVILGSSHASDYGVETAKSLARGLAASGVTVASGLGDGIEVAAHAGALEVNGATVAVLPGGLDTGPPAKRRSLYQRVRHRGCGIAELPRGSEARRWGRVASQRILVGLAQLVIVVEARNHPGDLAGARIARTKGRPLAAIPGRVTSAASSGTNALLLNGAHLIRGPADALELLFGFEAPLATARAGPPAELEPRLQTTLESVGEGRDTPEKLTRDGGDCGEVLLALSELELMGMLARGDGGRYVPRHPCLHDPSSSGHS